MTSLVPTAVINFANVLDLRADFRQLFLEFKEDGEVLFERVGNSGDCLGQGEVRAVTCLL